MHNPRRQFLTTTVGATAVLLTGCAVQAPQVATKEAPPSAAEQRAAQQGLATQAPKKPSLKHKIALGRISNETNYGRSLLRDSSGDPLGKQTTDLFSKALTESGAFLVFERPDIGKLEVESRIAEAKLNLVGVDVLVIGSLTEFGRKEVGATGFASQTRRQVAFAKVDIRVVDTSNAQILFATSGAGEASNEVSSTFGFGSQASYDGTLNDAAIRQAVSEAVSRLSSDFARRPWQTVVLRSDGGRVYVSGGKAQGLRPGTELEVMTLGERIKSPQTGAFITLPGRSVAKLRVDALFGDTELTEGSVASVISGSIVGLPVHQLVVRTSEVLQ